MRCALAKEVGAYRRDERGSAAIMVAPMMLVLVGMAALGVDMMNATTTQERLRTAAEAAAAAGASGLPNEADALDMALAFGEANLPENATGAITEDEVEFGYWDEDTRAFEPDPASDPVNAVRVTPTMNGTKGNALATWFGSVLGVATIDVASSAIALAESSSPPCIIALDSGGSQALSLNSNADFDLNCEVHSRSTSSSALYTDSNATIEATRVCVKGNYQENGNSDIDPDPETSCDAADDPFAAVAAPTVGSCNHSGKTVDNQTVTLSPGVYCGGLTIKNNANVTFNPGVYIIKDGVFLVDSNARITGDGVGFYLTGSSALLEFNSNSIINLKAPQSGPMAGMIFRQNSANSGTHKFDSNTAAVLDGAIYLPNATFTSNSNVAIGSGSACLMLVAKRIAFDSNSGVNLNADYSQCPWMPGGGSKHTKIVA